MSSPKRPRLDSPEVEADNTATTTTSDNEMIVVSPKVSPARVGDTANPEHPAAAQATTACVAGATIACVATSATATTFSIPQPPNSEGPPLHYSILCNSNTPPSLSLIRLIALKNLFSRQLPKMPRAYITRLILSPEHLSLALLPDTTTPLTIAGADVIGGICFRVFENHKFAEIAFCAVSSSQQVKGYGTVLMSCLKEYAKKEGIEYFLTYADNYAIGYFKKQGFTRVITMPKTRYNGLIKDYDGGTLMECYVNPCFDYATPGAITALVNKQKDFVLSRIAERSQSHVEYPPLKDFELPDSSMQKRADKSTAAAQRFLAVPGVAEAGWTVPTLLPPSSAPEREQRAPANIKTELLGILRKLRETPFAWPYTEPVSPEDVPDYFEVIKEPRDIAMLEQNVKKGEMKSKAALKDDIALMAANCKAYNTEGDTFYTTAVEIEGWLKSSNLFD